MQFRKDINGLRAIAVIGVVLFHFNASWMPGGFAGVDVFFVISGFLMTGIIFRGIEQDSFSLLKFYVARANRIIPALAVLCLFLLAVSWFYLNPFDYKVLSKHVISSIGFVSNFVYWGESGYFDAASHGKWLLHTWSLSAEWQFYILYPMAILILRKLLSLGAMKVTILIATILGFMFSVYATNKWPDPAYFLLPTRAWEMMIGAVAYLYPMTIAENRKRVLEWSGVLLIVLSYVFISDDNPWPGYLAFFPVFGAFLIIQAQRNDSLLTSNVIFQKIGAWSYSIYLWHWPLVVAIFYFSLSQSYVYLGLGLSLLFGFLSYKYIEKIRFSKEFKSILQVRSLQLGVVILLVGGYQFQSMSRYIDTNPSEMEPFIIGHNYLDDSGTLKFNDVDAVRVLNGANNIEDINIILVGDSNSAHYSYGITQENNLKVAHLWYGACFAFLDSNTKPHSGWMKGGGWEKDCHSLYKFVDVNKNVPVVIAQAWNEKEVVCVNNCEPDNNELDYNFFLKSELDKLIQYVGDRPMFIVGQIPAPKRTMVNCMKGFDTSSCERKTSDFIGRSVEVNKVLGEVSKNYDNVVFVNPFDTLCNDEMICDTIIDDKNLFYDDGHLSAYGSKKVWPYIENVIIENLETPPETHLGIASQ